MKREIRRCLLVLAASSLITACSGDGDGGSSAPATSSTLVSGSVVASSASGAAAKAALITDGSVAVSIASYDKANTKLGEAAVTSDAAGGFAAQLALSTGGGYVIVTATKDGYTQFQKRVDYTTPGKIELQAALQQANVAFAAPGSALASGIGKSAEPSFSFALVSFPDGTKKALAGTAIKAAKAAGATVETAINIPAASVPGVTKLKGELNAYDPATQSDRFPGSYTGTDKNGKDGKMISIAFDFMKITDADTGKSLGKVAADLVKAGVKKAADPLSTVIRHIYSNSCDNLFLEDYNSTSAGHQVPVWSLQSSTGKWVYIGEGTVSDSTGTTLASPDKTTCGSGNYYLTIQVANAEFAKSWWNLDHIVFATPKEVCLSGKFLFSDSSPVANQSLSLFGSAIDSKWGYTAADGTYSLSTVLLNSATTSRAATLSYYNENGVYTSANVTLGDSPACGPYSVTLAKPCEVSGKLTGDGFAYRYLRLAGIDFYRSISTDAAGNYSSKVKCGTDISLFISSLSSSSTSFNVDGTVAGSESSDDGSKAVLADIAAPNVAPDGYSWLSNNSVKINKSVTANISGYDEENNYPVSWTFNVKNGATVAFTTGGSFTASASASSDFSIATAGDYTTELVLTDSKNASRTVAGANMSVAATNRVPTVYAYADRSYVNSCGSNAINLFGSGSGPDSTTMTGAWTSAGGAVAGCNGGSGTSSISATCATTVPAGAGATYTYTYTVTDNNGMSGKQHIQISTYASAPWISALTATPTLVPVATAPAVPGNVTLSAVANNSDNAAMTGNWKVNGSAIAACPDVSINTGAATACTYTIPPTAAAGDIFNFTFTATACEKSVSRDVRVTYGTASDVTVVVQ